MKQLTITTIFILTTIFFSFSQTERKNQITVSNYFFSSSVVRFDDIDGAGDTENGTGLRFGLQYNRLLVKNLWIGTGLAYLQTSNVQVSPYYGDIERTENKQKSNILQVPVHLRYDILKWLYVKSGVNLDFQTNNKDSKYIDNQSGLGCSISLGLDFELMKNLHLNIEPELAMTTLIAFEEEKYQQHFILYGVNLKLGYRF